KRDAENLWLVFQERRDRIPGVGIPNAKGAPATVQTAGGDHTTPIGSEGRITHGRLVRQGRGNRLAGRSIPHSSRAFLFVPAAREDVPAVGTKRRSPHRTVMLQGRRD